MERIFLVGEYTPQIKYYFKEFFNNLNIAVSFTKKDPGCNKIAFFKRDNQTQYGRAFLETKTVLIKYPSPIDIEMCCVGIKGTVEPLRLFILVALHEYLHLKGLAHCNTKRCLMAKTNCSAKMSNGYCISCLSLLKNPLPLCPQCKEKTKGFFNTS